MPFTLGTAIPMLIQVGISYHNQRLSTKNTEEIRKIMQETKRTSQENSLRRDSERFLRNCQFQIEKENESRKDRLTNLNQEFLSSFKKMAHNATLASHYPLRISPYIIQKSVVPLVAEYLEDTREELLCILTNSNDEKFNTDILPYIDEMLCFNIALHWNKGSMHNVCYYQGIWDSRKTFVDEDIDNIKTVICTPTLTISPYIINGQLSFKINVWGMGCAKSAIVDTGFNISSLLSNEIDETISLIKPILLSTIGVMVDFFYWTTNYQPPLLPILLSKGVIQVSSELKMEMIKSYETLYRELALGKITSERIAELAANQIQNGQITEEEYADEIQNLGNVSELNMINFPNRGLDFLKSCLVLMGTSDASNMLIEQTMLAFYKATTDVTYKSLQEINVGLLDYDDMSIVTTLIKIANKSGNTEVAESLTSLISRKIRL